MLTDEIKKYIVKVVVAVVGVLAILLILANLIAFAIFNFFNGTGGVVIPSGESATISPSVVIITITPTL